MYFFFWIFQIAYFPDCVSFFVFFRLYIFPETGQRTSCISFFPVFFRMQIFQRPYRGHCGLFLHFWMRPELRNETRIAKLPLSKDQHSVFWRVTKKTSILTVFFGV